MKNDKTYLVKGLTTWMLDEIEVLNSLVEFKLILLRKPKIKFIERLNLLSEKGLIIIIEPYKGCLFLNDLILFIRLLFLNSLKCKNFKSLVFTIKSIYWYAILDKEIFSLKETIHAQFATQAAIIAALLKKHYSSDIEFSFTIHAHDIFFPNTWLNYLVMHCYKCFSISQYNIDYLNENYKINSEKIRLSRLGVFKPSFNRKKEFDNVLKIGCLGWFEKKKGLFFLLEALSIINKKNLNVKLILAGEGKLKKKILKYISDNNMGNMVTLIGPVFGQKKEEFFTSIDLFILPSIKVRNDMDGIPVVLMEAISYGIPIISTELSGIPEICKNNNGYLIAQRDALEISDKIEEVFHKRDHLIFLGYNALKTSEEYNIRTNTSIKASELQWV